MNWTKSGTLSVVSGQTIVYGLGTTWLSAGFARSGDILLIGDTLCEVGSFQSDIQLALRSPWQGATASGLSYALIHIGLLPSELALKVSTVLEKMQEVMAERFPETEWNIYGAQASDGDNWESDNQKCDTLLRGILPKVQGYFYTEITDGAKQNLWHTYEKIAAQFEDRFWMANIKSRREVATVFREFFKKRTAVAAMEQQPMDSLAYTPPHPQGSKAVQSRKT